MNQRHSSRFDFLHAIVSASLLLLVARDAVSAPWDLGAVIDIGAIYTDNIFLAEDGMEESDLVYMLKPEFYLESDGERTQANIRYRPEAYFYRDNGDADTVYHVVDATMTTGLIRDKLFLYLGASNTQSIILPEGLFPTSNIPISGNRTDSRVLEAKPYWQQQIGSVSVLLEAGYTDVKYDSDLLQSNDVITARASFDNFASQQGIAWGLDYNYTRTEYESSNPWEFQRVGANLGYWVNGTTRIFGAGGAETAIDDIEDLSPNLNERFWEAGLQYKPNDRLDFEAAVGKRSFGTSYRLRFDYQLRRGRTTLTYNETPTARGQLPTGARPIEDTDNLDNILDRPGQSDRFLQRRAEWTTNVDLNKSNFDLRLFGERRELRSSADGDPLDDEEYYGAAIRWDWDVGVNTNIGLGADLSRRTTDDIDDDLRRFSLTAAYNLSQRTSIRAEIMRSQQDRDESTLGNYTENQYRLYLRMDL